MGMSLYTDLREFIELLNSHDVEYLVVGAHCLAFHGVAPYRIDLLTGIDSVEFDEAWSSRVQGQLDGLRVNYLSKDLFIKNKLAVGRSQDIADAQRLRELKPDQGDTSL